jgi:hypothetical protein
MNPSLGSMKDSPSSLSTHPACTIVSGGDGQVWEWYIGTIQLGFASPCVQKTLLCPLAELPDVPIQGYSPQSNPQL